MKRWIHASKSELLSYKSLASDIKAYLERLGFEDIRLFHTTGRWPVTISIEFSILDKYDNYSNFCTGLDRYCNGERYDIETDEFFRNEEQYAYKIRDGVRADVEKFLSNNVAADIQVKCNIDGLHGTYFVIKLLPSIKK